MNSLLKMGLFMSLFILTLGFSQCRTAKDTLKIAQTIELSEVPITKAYYQKWIAGVRGGGSGVDLHIEKSVVMNKELITAYFRGKSVKFDPLTQNSTVYIARFKGVANQLYDINMEADAINEYGNKSPIKKHSIPEVKRKKNNQMVIKIKLAIKDLLKEILVQVSTREVV